MAMDDQALTQQFEQDSRSDQPFIVLTLAAGLIATLGLLANSSAVVIGAMLIAPWMLPLRAAAFAILQGRAALVARALLTLLLGLAITVGLSVLLGAWIALPMLGTEVAARTQPNLLDLGVALVAGGLSAYAAVSARAIASLAGTAIAVALVPPVCAFGLLLSKAQWPTALGAALLFAANLLGILSGALITLALLVPRLRTRFWHSRLGLVSLSLTALLLIPLSGSFLTLMSQARQAAALVEIQQAIGASLKNGTITLGQDSELINVRIDWAQNPPLIRASVRVTDPALPTARQVAAVQTYINQRQPIRYRLIVQRVSVDVIGPQTEPNPPEQVPVDPAAPVLEQHTPEPISVPAAI